MFPPICKKVTKFSLVVFFQNKHCYFSCQLWGVKSQNIASSMTAKPFLRKRMNYFPSTTLRAHGFATSRPTLSFWFSLFQLHWTWVDIFSYANRRPLLSKPVNLDSVRYDNHLRIQSLISFSAGLQAEVEVPYQYKTEYSGENEGLATELWEAINSTSAGAVALDHRWAASKGLIRAQDFPWDTDKGLYYIQGIHDVHCVVSSVVTQFFLISILLTAPAEATSAIHIRVSSRAGAVCQPSPFDPLPRRIPAPLHVHGRRYPTGHEIGSWSWNRSGTDPAMSRLECVGFLGVWSKAPCLLQTSRRVPWC